MKTVIFLISILTSIVLSAQEKQIEFGNISMEEMELQSYDKDPEAKALVLFDVGLSKFVYESERGYDIHFVRNKRIKIFQKEGTEEYAEISIPFYDEGFGKAERILDLEAYTYNLEDGRIVKKALKASSVFEEQTSEYWKSKKFVFPDVQDGSVIEYTYKLITPFYFNLPDWVFQDKIPTKFSQYVVRMIPFYEYIFLAQGISRFDYQHTEEASRERQWGSMATSNGVQYGSGFKFRDIIHTYALNDVPAFKDEAYITSINDYIKKMDFQLARFNSPNGNTEEILTTWEKLSKSLLSAERFGKYLKGSGKRAQKALEELQLEGLSENDKCKAIIEYVRNNYTWNGYHSNYASKSPKEFEDQKSGNVTDINLFLVAMLNAADIDAVPVMTSTRSHGKIKMDYPYEHFFNYTLVYVNSQKPFLTDGTDHLLRYNRIPPKCMNDKGLLVNKGEVNWVSLDNNLISIEKNVIHIQPNLEELTAAISLDVQSTEYSAYYYKNSFKNDSIELKNHLKNEVLTDVDAIRMINYEKAKSPYILQLTGTAELEALGDNIIIRPFLDLDISENKLKQKKRLYPVDLVYPFSNEYVITIDIPEGYVATELPKAYDMQNDLADIVINYSSEENFIKIKAKYEFKKAVYEVNEYGRIKYYLDEIVKHFNYALVLQKE